MVTGRAVGCLVLTVAVAGLLTAQDPGVGGDLYQSELRPALSRYCFKCHGERRPKGGVVLSTTSASWDVGRDYRLWRRVVEAVQSGAMPPEDHKKQPPDKDRAALVAGIQTILNDSAARVDPGRSLLRRLNRRQYERTVRDVLFGLPVRVTDRFPKDPQGYGFDTVGDVLFSSPLLIEQYLDVTDEVLEAFSKRQDLMERLLLARPKAASDLEVAATQTLTPFLRSAFRRPVTQREVRSRVDLVKAEVKRGLSFESSILSAVKSVLLSPQFLFRVEADRDTDEPWVIDDHELAVRLSYFLWSTMPDAALRAAADRGELRSDAGLRKQIRRMLEDPRSRALADDFASQWLGYREILRHAADVRRFKGFDQALKNSMYEESARFFDHLVRNDKHISLLLDAGYSFLNERLARHYEIDGVKGPKIRRVVLPDRRRGGVLGMASVLAPTSYPLRTSPVQRGKWVLENILDDPPPPPPPDAGSLPPDDKTIGKLSLRQQLERHSSEAACRSCHAKMDPLGIALESFDGIGRWRTRNHDHPIDAKATLWDGSEIDGLVALKDWLKGHEDIFIRTATRKLLVYALGRDLTLPDEKVVRSIVERVQSANGSTQSLIESVAMSYPFRHRRGPHQR